MKRYLLLLLMGMVHGATALDDVTYMRERIGAFHGTLTNTHRVLKVVYFQPRNVEPQPGFRERIPRILEDIQGFYRSEMERIGYGDATFPLERVDDELRIHVVTGREAAGAYGYASGNKIAQEVDLALGDALKLKHDFVLILHNLCRKRDDGSYFFHAPYYGDGASNHRRGLCHAADCERLDPAFFTDTDRKIVYEEHTGTFKQTLAEFNVKYIGGVAHELGHGLGLPHNLQTGDEFKRLGTALMGSGNHTYRRELQGRKGSFLSLASATRLASHPLFTRSDHGTDTPVTCVAEKLTFRAEDKGLLIAGTLAATPEVYAVIGYVDPQGRGDYDARTFVAPVHDGAFALPVYCVKPSNIKLRIVACHVNGAASNLHRSSFSFDGQYTSVADTLTTRHIVDAVERRFLDGHEKDAAQQARALLAADTTPARARLQLEHLIVLAEGRNEAGTQDDAAESISLADSNWVSARVGWGKPARNHYYYDRRVRDALLFELGGTFYEKGLYAHAPSTYVFDLQAGFQRFNATVGLQAGAASVGSAIFIVRGDGEALYRSGLLKGMQTEHLDLDISGIKRLELIVESGKEGNACCWSVWGHPRISRK